MANSIDSITPAPSREFKPVVVVPTFNHGHTIPAVLDGLRTLGLPIIVVDDGSTDQTDTRLAEWRCLAPDAELEIRTHAVNCGKAAALLTGFATAEELGTTHAVTIDSDGQLDPSDIPALLERARQNPRALILGERPPNMPGCPARCAAGRRITSLAIRAQCGVRITDSQCGLRIYPLEIVRAVRCRANRFSFEAEIITRVTWAGYPVITSPVNCRYLDSHKRTSHFRPWADSLRQTGVHGRLLLRAMLPWTQRRSVVITDASNTKSRAWWRRFLTWINPARCWREARGGAGDLGRLEFATAVALGVWIGTTPLFGLHALLCAYLAWRLHLHPIPMVLGSQISTPPVGVFLAIASTFLGQLVLTGRLLNVADMEPGWNSLPSMLWSLLPAWCLGSILLGFVLGAIVFWLIMLPATHGAGQSRTLTDATLRISEKRIGPT